MKILVVCDEGNNRSITIASRIKYLGHDVLSAGLNRNEPETLLMLEQWADRIITTDQSQQFPWKDREKVRCWDIGPDVYKRPFNPELLRIVTRMIETNKADING